MLSVTSPAQSDPGNPTFAHPLLLALSVATKVKEIVVESAADTTPNGLLGLVQAQGVNTIGLKSTAVVDTANVVYKSDPGVSIQVKLKTDDHPRKWFFFNVANCVVSLLT